MRVDVAVIGGGSAGVAAAVSAARAGARVVLVERQGLLGGQASFALVHTICGLYLLRENDDSPLVPANPGFPIEFARRLLAAGGARGPLRMGRLDVLLHEPDAFASVASELCAGQPEIDVRLGAEILEASPDADGIRLLVQNPAGLERVMAAAVVDATGDAVVASLAGAVSELSPLERLQRPAYIFKLGGVAESSLAGDARLRIAQAVSAAVYDGALPAAALGVAFRAGVASGEVWGTIDLAAGNFDPRMPALITDITAGGRAAAMDIARFLRGAVEGFRDAVVTAVPVQAGIRESRRIAGLYQLTGSDISDGTGFEDAVAWSAWPIELREKPTGPKFRYPGANRPCGIPLRALRSRDLDRLFMAGRCISCTHEAQAAIRVIGTCLATGEAAGKAAALQAVS